MHNDKLSVPLESNEFDSLEGGNTLENVDFILEGKRIKSEIDKYRKENSLVFPLFSDLHTDSANAIYTKQLLKALHAICCQTNIDAVIDLGDNLSMLGREKHISNEQLVAILTELFDSIYNTTKCPIFLINGNHDAVGTDFFKPKLFNQIAKGKYDNSLAHYHTEGSYYYVDYAKANLRLVFLSVPYESDIDAVNPTPLWAFGREQLEWLKKEALNTNCDVLLFSHAPFFYRYNGNPTTMLTVWNGEKTAESYISALCGRIDDVEEAASILNASDKVIACFSGHTHVDSFWQPYEKKHDHTNPLSCPQIVTACAIPRNGTENLFGVVVDILVWDPDEHTVHIVRFGDGENRKI